MPKPSSDTAGSLSSGSSASSSSCSACYARLATKPDDHTFLQRACAQEAVGKISRFYIQGIPCFQQMVTVRLFSSCSQARLPWQVVGHDRQVQLYQVSRRARAHAGQPHTYPETRQFYFFGTALGPVRVPLLFRLEVQMRSKLLRRSDPLLTHGRLHFCSRTPAALVAHGPGRGRAQPSSASRNRPP